MARFSESIGGGDGFRLSLVKRAESTSFYVEIRRRDDAGKWKREHSSLGTADENTARVAAFSLMAELLQLDSSLALPARRGRPPAAEVSPEKTGTGLMTLGRVVELYVESPKFLSLAEKTRYQYNLAFDVLLDFVDQRTNIAWRDMDATFLDQDRLDSFTKARLEGSYEHPRIRPGYGGPTTVRNYYVGLKAACTWAYRTKNQFGKRLLADKVFDGLELPFEKNLRQPLMETEWLDQLLALSEEPWPYNAAGTRHFKLALLMGEAFGNRINAILHMQWSNINWKTGELYWNPEFDKMEQGRTSPIPEDVLIELRYHYELRPKASPWVFWAKCDHQKPTSYETALGWLINAFPLACGIKKPDFLGYHGLRRKWKTDREDLPLKAVMDAAGWRSAASALRYDKPSKASIEKVIGFGRDRVRGTKVGTKVGTTRFSENRPKHRKRKGHNKLDD